MKIIQHVSSLQKLWQLFQKRSIKIDCEEENIKENNGEDENKVEFLILCVCLTLFILSIGVGLAVYLKMRNRKTNEEPKMEMNVDYGKEDDYYDEHNNRVEDINGYYE